MATATGENAPPTLEERYSTAHRTSQLDSDNIQSGPVHLLMATAMVWQNPTDRHGNPLSEHAKASSRIGHALARLQSEWNAVERPTLHQPKSLRYWIGFLPLIKVGQRSVDGEMKPIMGRDKEGAKLHQEAERMMLQARHVQELKFLAQKLPSRFTVRESLFGMANQWGWDDAEQKVSEILKHWLDDNCVRCHGTGVITFTLVDIPQTCPDCHGAKKSPVPYGNEGRRMLDFITSCRVSWLGAVKRWAKKLRAGVDDAE